MRTWVVRISLSLLVVSLLSAIFLYYATQTSTTVNIERSFNAPVEKVWELWTDANTIKKWWGPKNYTAPAIKNDFRTYGSFLFSMQAPDGKISWNSGKYLEIVTFKKIVSTMSFANEKGELVPASSYGIPGKWPDEILVSVEFEEINGKTRITLSEAGIPLIMSLFAKMGWQQQFDKFEKLL